MAHYSSESKLLALAVIAGLSFGASISGIFLSSIPFSIYPVLAFLLAIFAAYPLHLANAAIEGRPAMELACFLAGLFGHSAFLRMQVPELGSNFGFILVTMALVLWVCHKKGWWVAQKEQQPESA